MPLNPSTIGTLLRTELRMLARDRRTLLTSVLLPLLLTPVMLFAVSWMNRVREKKLEQTTYRYAVMGSAADQLRTTLASSRDRSEDATAARDDFRFHEIEVVDATTALANGDVHFYIEALTVEEARAREQTSASAARATATSEAEATIHDDASVASPAAEPLERSDDLPVNWREPRVDGAPVITLVYRADRDDSSSGMSRLRSVLRDARNRERAEALRARGFPIAPAELARVDEHNVASAGQVAGLELGRGITLFVLLFLMSGCAIVATDTLAGEKERGTLETLLTSSATRLEIIIAKHLAVFVVAVTIATIQIANLLVYVGFELIPVPPNLAAAVPPGVTLLLLLLFLPLTALAASVLLLTSGYAKSYKEAQLYFTPVFLVGGLLAFASFLPDLPLRSAIVLLPVANIAVAAREILVGSFDWWMIATAWLVTAAAAVGATQLSVRFLSAEKLITVSDTDAIDFAGGPAVFPRHVLRWFVVLWALLLIVSNYAAPLDVRVQIAINLVGLFFGASVLMLRHYRLDVRETLALRAPHPLAWVAVGFGVPGGILAGFGIFYLADLIFPASPELLEQMTEAFQFEQLPVWQVVLFVAIFPGIFEEIAFRGLLLHGLHRKLHPVVLVLVVGVIFGLFHVTLPRIIPTAYIGVLLTALVLLTGSIYPAMLWHAANNAIMLLFGERLQELTGANPLYCLPGAAVLVLCFWILLRWRTPYPGLQTRRAAQARSSD